MRGARGTHVGGRNTHNAPRARRGLAAAVGLAALASARTAAAQDQLAADVLDRCARAVVRVIAVGDDQHGSVGSGSVIDPRGYVLTSYHVVAHARPDGAPLGTFYNPQNRVVIALADDLRQPAAPRYVGTVVRADARLDLALVRVVSDLAGHPVTAPAFASVATAPARELRPGARVFALGFPANARSINVTAGAVTGLQTNARGEAAWLRTSVPFNPGNSGGMLVDAAGRLVAVPTGVLRGVASQPLMAPIDLARPVERLPAAWLAELRRGPIDDVRIDGLPTLHAGLTIEDQAVGDVTAVEGAEAHLFRLPPLRPALVVVTPAVPVGVFAADGTALREGQGRVAVLAGDPSDAFVAVAFDAAADHATTVRVRLDPGRAEGAVGDTHGAVAAAAQASWIAEPAAPSAADAVPAAQPARPVPAQPAPAQPAPAQPAPGVTPRASTSANAAGVTARGTIVDAATGQALDGAVFVVDPDVDAGALLARFLAGRMTERQFRARVAEWVLTGADGRFAFAGLRRGASYTIGAYAAGYRPVFRALTPTQDAPATWELPAVGLTRAR